MHASVRDVRAQAASEVAEAPPAVEEQSDAAKKVQGFEDAFSSKGKAGGSVVSSGIKLDKVLLACTV